MERLTNMQIFQAVAAGRMTAEQGASLMLAERENAMTRNKHILALIVSLATAVLPLWVDASQTLVGKITGSIVTALLLGVSTEKLKSQRNAILGGLAVAGIVATAIMGKFSSGSLGLAIVGNVLAVLTQLRVVLARQLADDAAPSASQPKVAIITQPDTTPTKPAA